MAESRVGETSRLDSVSPVTLTHSVHGAQNDESVVDETAAREDSGSSVDHVHEKAQGPRRTKRQKVKTHFRRFWWAYLIGVIVLLAILLPVLFEVIIPAIVQNILNGQGLPVKSGEIRVLSPTQLNISLITELDTPLPAKLDALTLDLFNKGESERPFINITLPDISVDGKTDAVVKDQTVTIRDYGGLVEWFHGVFDQKNVEVSVRGKPKVHLGELDYNPNLDKVLKIPALNQLDGFGIQELELVLPPDENGFNVRGNLSLPNQGALTLALGNVTFNLLSGDVVLGYASIYDVEMKPGMNRPYFEGELFLRKLIPNLPAILDSQKHALTSGNLEFNATGNRTVVDGERIKYVEDVLNSKLITFQMPVITLLTDVLNGLLGDSGSLLDMFGDVFGNETLAENVLEHWNFNETAEEEDGASTAQKMKRALKQASPWGSLGLNVMKLGARTDMHHKREL